MCGLVTQQNQSTTRMFHRSIWIKHWCNSTNGFVSTQAWSRYLLFIRGGLTKHWHFDSALNRAAPHSSGKVVSKSKAVAQKSSFKYPAFGESVSQYYTKVVFGYTEQTTIFGTHIFFVAFIVQIFDRIVWAPNHQLLGLQTDNFSTNKIFFSFAVCKHGC